MRNGINEREKVQFLLGFGLAFSLACLLLWLFLPMLVLADSHDCATQGHEDDYIGDPVNNQSGRDYKCDHCGLKFGYQLDLVPCDEEKNPLTVSSPTAAWGLVAMAVTDGGATGPEPVYLGPRQEGSYTAYMYALYPPKTGDATVNPKAKLTIKDYPKYRFKNFYRDIQFTKGLKDDYDRDVSFNGTGSTEDHLYLCYEKRRPVTLAFEITPDNAPQTDDGSYQLYTGSAGVNELDVEAKIVSPLDEGGEPDVLDDLQDIVWTASPEIVSLTPSGDHGEKVKITTGASAGKVTIRATAAGTTGIEGRSPVYKELTLNISKPISGMEFTTDNTDRGYVSSTNPVTYRFEIPANPGDKYQLRAKQDLVFTPSDGVVDSYAFSLDPANTDAALLLDPATGLVTLKKAGEVTLNATVTTAGNGTKIYASVRLKIIQGSDSVDAYTYDPPSGTTKLTEISLIPGDTQQLSAEVKPSYSSYAGSKIWHMDPTNSTSVLQFVENPQTGKIIAGNTEGDVEVYAESGDHVLSNRIKVHVRNYGLSFSGSGVIGKTATLYMGGGNVLVTPNVVPDVERYNSNITFTYTETDVVSCTKTTEGKLSLEPKKTGTAYIHVTAKSKEGTGDEVQSVSETLTVTVSRINVTDVVVKDDNGDTISGKRILQLGKTGYDTIKLSPSALPVNASTKGISYITSDENHEIITITPNSQTDPYPLTVTAVDPGTATVTFRADDGYGAERVVTIQVVQPVTGVAIDCMEDSEFFTTYPPVSLGKTYTMIPKVTPADASVTNFVWTISDPGLASLTPGTYHDETTGKDLPCAYLKGLALGHVNLKVTALDAAGNSVDSPVDDREVKAVKITGITLDKTSGKIFQSGEVTLTPTIAPYDASEQTLSASVEAGKESVASASVYTDLLDGKQKVRVKGLTAGTAEITVAATDGSGKKAVYQVTVVTKPSKISLKLDGAAAENKYMVLDAASRGTTYHITASIEPAAGLDAKYKHLTWVCLDSAGTAFETTSEETATGKKDVTVGDKDSDVAVLTYKTDESDPTVSHSCDVSVWNPGPVRIVAKWSPKDYPEGSEGNVEDVTGEIFLTASPVVTTGVTLQYKNAEPGTLEMEAGSESSGDLVAYFNPWNSTLFPTKQGITWTSSNTRIANVEGIDSAVNYAAGKAPARIMAYYPGTVTLTATAENGSKAECSLTVNPRSIGVNDIVINKKTIELEVGGSEQVLVQIGSNYEDPEVYGVSFKSSDTAVATVDASGTVYARSVSSSPVTITASIGAKSASCSVIVKAKAEVLQLKGVSVPAVERLYTVASSTTKNSVYVTAGVEPEAVAAGARYQWFAEVEKNGRTVTDYNIIQLADSGSRTVRVTAVAAGSATLRCNVTANGTTMSATTVVEVLEGLVNLSITSGLSANSENIFTEGSLMSLGVSFSANSDPVEWMLKQYPASGGQKVIAVSDGAVNGDYMLSALHPGTATLQLVGRDNPGAKSPEYSIRVEKKVVLKGISILDANTNTTVKKANFFLRDNGKIRQKELTVKFNPANIPNPAKVYWNSSNDSVVRVVYNNSGGSSVRLEADKAGKAVVTASCETFSASLEVTVSQATNKLSICDPTGISITQRSLYPGNQLQLGAMVAPGDTTDSKRVTWKAEDTRNKGVVSINAQGLLVAKKEGEARILATVPTSELNSDGTPMGVKRAELYVTVEAVQDPAGGDKTLGLSINKKAVTLTDKEYVNAADQRNTTPELSLTVSVPKTKWKNLRDYTVTWNVSRPKDVMVERDSNSVSKYLDNGKCTAVFKTNHISGTVYISATVSGRNGRTQTVSCKVRVNKPVTKVTITKDDNGGPDYNAASAVSLKAGERAEFNARYFPTDATNASAIAWSSTKGSVAAISGGSVLAKLPGAAVIKAKIAGVWADNPVDMTVTGAPTNLVLNKSSATLQIGSRLGLSAKALPADIARAAGGTLAWHVDASGLKSGVSVNERTGQVSVDKNASGGAQAKVTATWTPTAGGSAISATCVITVAKPVKSVTLSGDRNPVLYINPISTGELSELTLPEITTVPADATNTGGAVWKSSNSRCFEIVGTKARPTSSAKPGKYTLTATVGGKSAKLTVTLKQHATAIKIHSVDRIAMTTGRSAGFGITYTPSCATDVKAATLWSVSDYSKITLNNRTGIATDMGARASIRALAEGSCTLTAKDEEANLTKELVVLVSEPASGLSWGAGDRFDAQKKLMSLRTGSGNPPYRVPELNATYKEKGARIVSPTMVLWTSSNTKVASVDENGVITIEPLPAGTAKKTCTIKGVYGGRSLGFTLEITR